MLLKHLKEETQLVHESLERRLDLLSPQLTPDRYARVLRVFHSFYAPWEAMLDRLCPPQYADLWRDRRKAHLLEEDLRCFPAQPETAVPALALPRIPDGAAWLGSLYVMEGATLGGKIIARHLEQAFGWSAGAGCSFFLSYGEEVGNRWRTLCKVLSEPSLQPQTQQVVAGAHHTFSCLDQWIAATL